MQRDRPVRAASAGDRGPAEPAGRVVRRARVRSRRALERQLPARRPAAGAAPPPIGALPLGGLVPGRSARTRRPCSAATSYEARRPRSRPPRRSWPGPAGTGPTTVRRPSSASSRHSVWLAGALVRVAALAQPAASARRTASGPGSSPPRPGRGTAGSPRTARRRRPGGRRRGARGRARRARRRSRRLLRPLRDGQQFQHVASQVGSADGLEALQRVEGVGATRIQPLSGKCASMISRHTATGSR